MIIQVQPTELQDWIRSQATSVVLLDVREAWEVALASLQPQAGPMGFDWMHIPMNSIPSQIDALRETLQDKALVCLCHHGARSQNVARYLEQNGLLNHLSALANLSGGIAAWSSQVDASVAQY
jgi:rhodanese-related sulfurtransferase